MEFNYDLVDSVITDKLGEHCKCSLCNKEDWGINPKLFEVRPYEKGSLNLPSTIVPFVLVSCLNCGNTHYLNAIVLKIVDSSGEIAIKYKQKNAGLAMGKA